MSFELSVLLLGACMFLTVLFLATLVFLLMLVFHGYTKIVKSDTNNTLPAIIGVVLFAVGFLWFAFIGLKGIWFHLFWLNVFHH